MSWDVKYYCEWTDILGLDWRADIEKDGSFTATSMQATGDPLNIEYLAKSDSFFENPVRGSVASLTVFSETNFQWNELVVVEDQEFRMSIYYNDGTDHLYWRGFIMPDSYQEPYDKEPYQVTISASDGLGILQNIPFDNSGTPYNGRQLESVILLNILAKIEHTEFTEYVNIYETTMEDGVGDSPIDQLKIDVDVFLDKTCYEVLEEILKKYNAVIRMVDAKMIIYRPVELQDMTVYGRTFTVGTKTAVTLSPGQHINRSTNASDLWDVEGGMKGYIGTAKKVTVNQDYGYKESWIDNWQFKADTFDGTDFDFWTEVTGGGDVCDPEPISVKVPSEENGMLLAGFNNQALPINWTTYMEQLFGTNAIVSTDLFMLEFDYALYNTNAFEIYDQIIRFGVISSTDTYWLYDVDDAPCEWANSYDTVVRILTPCSPGFSGWIHFSCLVNGLPENGPYKMRLYPMSGLVSAANLCIKDIKFYTTSSKTLQKRIKRTVAQRFRGHDPSHFWFGGYGPRYRIVEYREEVKNIVEYSYIKTNAINGKELEFDCILGDVLVISIPPNDADTNLNNVLEQFAGSLATSLSSLTNAASAFVTSFATSYLPTVVTSSANGIIFTAATAGTPLPTEPTITLSSGDLSGIVVVNNSNKVAVAMIDKILLSGFNGRCEYGTTLGVKEAIFDIDLDTTATTFVTDNEASFLSTNGVILTKEVVGSDVYLVLEDAVAGVNFTTVVNRTSGSLDGTISHSQAYEVAEKQVDTVYLTGTNGTADVECDGVIQEVSVTETLAPSIEWLKRNAVTAYPLLEISAAEIANQYSRTRQRLQLPIMERDTTLVPHVNLIGNFKDDLNQIGGNDCIFVFNKGIYNIADRMWNTDLIEIVT